MKKLLMIVFLIVLLLAACAELKIAADIVDIFTEPVPVPLVCGEKTVGTANERGEVCRLFTDGKYRWTK